MMLFWLGVAVLTFIAIFILFYPLLKLRGAKTEEMIDTRQQDNVDVYQDRLEELDLERQSGSVSEDEFSELKLELEKNLLIDTQVKVLPTVAAATVSKRQFVLVILMVIALPISALGLYMNVGSAQQLAASMNLSDDPFQGGEPTFEEAVAQLKLELQANPDNPEGWYILGSTLMGQGNYAEGLDAMQQVEKLLSQDDPQYASVMGQIAQAMFFSSGSMTPEVMAKVDQTLALEPFEITALGLKGIDAFERKAYREAIEFWQKALINADGDTANAFQSGVIRAKEELAAAGEDVSDIQLLEVARIPLNVAVNEALISGLPLETPVFIVARPLTGGMPLAAVRLRLADLPASLELSDAQSMSPQALLSSVDQVNLSVRISVSGNVSPQPGDMIVQIGPVPTKGVEIPLELLVQEVVK